MKLLKTGIAGFDEFLGGGLPAKLILLSGLPGSGNEVFARQIAYFQAKQAAVTYFTINATPASVREDMLLYNWDTAALETAGNWRFKFLVGNNPAKLVLEEMDQNRIVVIDSVSELLYTCKIHEITDLISAMCHQNRGDQYHLLLLTEGMQSQRTETALQHFCEGTINFNTSWMTDIAVKDIAIKKLKGTFAPTKRLPYSIGKRGFLIETATRIT